MSPWASSTASCASRAASSNGMAVSASVSFSEKVVRLAQNMELAHAFLWEHSYKRLKLAQLLGQLGVFLT